MDNLYFYLTLVDKPDSEEIALNHGFFWAASEDEARGEIANVFSKHYKCEPDAIQSRVDQITPAEVLRIIAQRVAYEQLPLKLFGVVINMPLPDNQRDMFVNIAMAESKEELQEMYHEMILEKFPGYDLSELELLVDEYEVHQILSHMADLLEN